MSEEGVGGEYLQIPNYRLTASTYVCTNLSLHISTFCASTTRITIEAAHFRQKGFWMTGLLNPNSSQCQYCFEQGRFCILGPWDCSPGSQFSGEVRSLEKITVNLYHRTPPTFDSKDSYILGQRDIGYVRTFFE